ncbi:hypothetical protein [Paraburkholderia eburnea]|uniref:hypothetical protein n=1 Tax=Paraburkholderia eburnea TaxID=1189126 RepID=UPI00117E761F|nr:hypothetical protein [Paraburkholderia eburnea]
MRIALREHYPREARFNKIRKTLLPSMRIQSGFPEKIPYFPQKRLPDASTLPLSRFFSFFAFSNPVEL